jgi:hypothetical protein
MGFLYLLFCWTLIPHLVAFVECFFLPDRVSAHNALLAAAIAAQIRGMGSVPGMPVGVVMS